MLVFYSRALPDLLSYRQPKIVAWKQTLDYFFILGQWLNFKLFWDYIFSRENKVQTFFFRVQDGWVSNCYWDLNQKKTCRACWVTPSKGWPQLDCKWSLFFFRNVGQTIKIFVADLEDFIGEIGESCFPQFWPIFFSNSGAFGQALPDTGSLVQDHWVLRLIRPQRGEKRSCVEKTDMDNFDVFVSFICYYVFDCLLCFCQQDSR